MGCEQKLTAHEFHLSIAWRLSTIKPNEEQVAEVVKVNVAIGVVIRDAACNIVIEPADCENDKVIEVGVAVIVEVETVLPTR